MAWGRSNKLLETISKDWGPCWQCRGCRVLVHHVPTVLHWKRTGNCGGHLKKWTQRSAQRNLGEMIQALWKCYVIQAIVISLKLKETKVLQKVVRPLHHYQPEPWIHFLPSECCIRNWDSLVRTIFPGLLSSSLVKPVSTDRLVFCKIPCLVLRWDGLLQTLAVASGDSICNLGFIFLSLTQFIISFRGPDCWQPPTRLHNANKPNK